MAASTRARREVREHFESVAAFDGQRAIRYDPPTRLHDQQFELLISQGIIKEGENHRFWLDRAADESERVHRSRALVMLLIIIIAGILIAGVISAALAGGH